MTRSTTSKEFELEEEPAAVRDAYGRNPFGQGCLLVRRLVQRNVPFVEVTLSAADESMVLDWDPHQKNFEAVEKLSNVLDPAWAKLMTDLRTRGLFDSTLIVWMGQFGRTPRSTRTPATTTPPTRGRQFWPAGSGAARRSATPGPTG